MKEIDLSSYTPDWRGGVHKNNDEEDEEYGWFWDPAKKHELDMEFVVSEQDGIKWKHVVQAMENLAAKHFYNGPFTDEEFGNELSEIMTLEALQGLVDKGILKKVGEDSWELTELGKQLRKDLL